MRPIPRAAPSSAGGWTSGLAKRKVLPESPPVDRPLRIALLLDPFALTVKGGDYVPRLARELLGRGHAVRGFGAPPGVIPRSGPEREPDGAGRLEFPGVVGFQPDVVVAHDALSPAAFLGARAAGRLGVPLVLVEPGVLLGGRPHERVLRWVGERLWGPLVRRRARAVVALDPPARDQALEEGFASERVRVLPAGVDLATFRPGLTSHVVRSHRIAGRILLYVGRLDPDRGLEVLIQAFARTLGQGRDWALVLAGDGPRPARQALRALVERQGIGARVHWLAGPRDEELPGLLGSATVLAVPALDDRVRGIHVPRALACGVPVLASRLPRFEALFDDEEAGLLVRAGDLEAWCAALQRAGGAPEARRRWALRARAVAEERLGWEAVGAAFEAVLVECVGGTEPPPRGGAGAPA
jgi:glycosyltransferase involved in cell wall biosynthesis